MPGIRRWPSQTSITSVPSNNSARTPPAHPLALASTLRSVPTIVTSWPRLAVDGPVGAGTGGLVGQLLDITLFRIFRQATGEPAQITFGRGHGFSWKLNGSRVSGSPLSAMTLATVDPFVPECTYGARSSCEC
jgi:hypothetical protein